MKKHILKPTPVISVIVLLAMATLILFAVQPWAAWSELRPSDFRGWNLFSFFTVQSNLLAALVYALAVVVIIRRKAFGEWFYYLRGGAVLYMLVTGIVYTTLLQNNPDASPVLGFDWKNFVLHQFGPIFIVMWWLLWPSEKSVSPKQALWWLLFPLVWIIYTLIRGAFLNWYPYPFLSPELVGGWGAVSLYILGITAAFIGLSQLLAWISRERRRNDSLY